MGDIKMNRLNISKHLSLAKLTRNVSYINSKGDKIIIKKDTLINVDASNNHMFTEDNTEIKMKSTDFTVLYLN